MDVVFYVMYEWMKQLNDLTDCVWGPVAHLCSRRSWKYLKEKQKNILSAGGVFGPKQTNKQQVSPTLFNCMTSKTNILACSAIYVTITELKINPWSSCHTHTHFTWLLIDLSNQCPIGSLFTSNSHVEASVFKSNQRLKWETLENSPIVLC